MRIGIASLTFTVGLVIAGQASAQPARERLVVGKVPAETPWKTITNASSGDHWLWEQVPANETGDDHTDILVAQGFANLAGADPAVFLHGMVGLAQKDCNNVRVNGPVPRIEDGHHIAYEQIYCGRRNGQTHGLSMFYKVVSGTDALYVVEREITTPGSNTAGAMAFNKNHAQEALALMRLSAAANQFLDNSVYLCDAQSTDPRCKAPPAP
jgi:hypothetical protein